jgi:hypothetical protein
MPKRKDLAKSVTDGLMQVTPHFEDDGVRNEVVGHE